MALQAGGGGFQEERQERLGVSREDALKRAQQLFEKRGDEIVCCAVLPCVTLWCGVLS